MSQKCETNRLVDLIRETGPPKLDQRFFDDFADYLKDENQTVKDAGYEFLRQVGWKPAG